MKPLCFAALLGCVAVVSMAQAGEPNCTRASYSRSQTLLSRMSPGCGCGAGPSCAAPSCRAPSCAAPTCAAPTCAAPTCAAPTCAAPSCACRARVARPTCAAPTCAAPTCAAPTCAAPSCDAQIINIGCNTCGRTACACPRLIPALMGRIDCVLQRIYSNPCNPVCGRPCRSRASCSDIWDGYQSNCGCDAGCGGGENWVPSTSPTPTKVGDPFQDDDLRAPPPVPTEARRSRPTSKTSLARLRVMNQEPTLAKPPVHHQSAVSIRFVDGEIENVDQVKTEVVPVSMETPTAKPFPKNPLRD